VLVDLASHGRTIDLWRNRFELRLGPSVEYVKYGTVLGPSSRHDQWALRGLLGLRAAASTFDRQLRLQFDASWRPDFLDFSDHVLETSLTLGTFFGPIVNHSEVGLMLGVRARVQYATHPAAAISTWGDPSSALNAGIELVTELLWWG
jgi:hypothetical protein